MSLNICEIFFNSSCLTLHIIVVLGYLILFNSIFEEWTSLATFLMLFITIIHHFVNVLNLPGFDAVLLLK